MSKLQLKFDLKSAKQSIQLKTTENRSKVDLNSFKKSPKLNQKPIKKKK